MTVQELYDLAKENDALDKDIEIQYRDSGGFDHLHHLPYLLNPLATLLLVYEQFTQTNY